MKLLLIQPPVREFYDTDIRLQPVGLCYLKAAVRKYLPQAEVVIRDFRCGRGRRTVALPDELAYLRDFYGIDDRGPFSTFHNFYHFGADCGEIAAKAAAENPDLVGISSLFSPYYREVLSVAEAVKETLRVPVFLGGTHVSAMPRMMLSHPAVDFVIRGEGERPLVEFLKAWSGDRDWGKVPNLGFKRDGGMVFNEIGEGFREKLPPPDLSDFSPDDYLFEGRPLAFVIASRGCPHRCDFCSVRAVFGRTYRRRDTADVLEEIRLRYGAGYRVFDFEDDNLTFDTDAMKELCRGLIDEYGGRDVRFLAMNGISYRSLDAELLGLMRRAGFTDLNLSLVSADPGVRAGSGRPHSTEQYLETVAGAFALGFKIVSYQILGLPGEEPDSMVRTMTLNARLPVLLGASMFYLAPGSALAEEFGPLGEDDVFKARLTAMACKTGSLPREDMYTLFVTCRILNFFKGLAAGRGDLRLDEALELAARSGRRSALGAEILRRLFAERILYAAAPRGFRPLPGFRFGIFEKVWRGLDWIMTRGGAKIVLDGAGPEHFLLEKKSGGRTI